MYRTDQDLNLSCVILSYLWRRRLGKRLPKEKKMEHLFGFCPENGWLGGLCPYTLTCQQVVFLHKMHTC